MYICNYKNAKIKLFWLTSYIFKTSPGESTSFEAFFDIEKMPKVITLFW